MGKMQEHFLRNSLKVRRKQTECIFTRWKKNLFNLVKWTSTYNNAEKGFILFSNVSIHQRISWHDSSNIFPIKLQLLGRQTRKKTHFIGISIITFLPTNTHRQTRMIWKKENVLRDGESLHASVSNVAYIRRKEIWNIDAPQKSWKALRAPWVYMFK